MGKLNDRIQKAVFEPFAKYLEQRAQDSSFEKSKGVLRQVVQSETSAYGSNRIKPNSNVSFDTLRKLSVTYDVARACINARKRQISQLEWKIASKNESDDTDYTKLIEEVESYFYNIGGYNLSFRKIHDLIIEDLMVLDAVALEYVRTYGGELDQVLPIDSSTIKLIVDKSGRTPQPPEIAYRQIVDGKVTAEFTAEEMFYGMLNPRTNSAYGLAPLETLVLTVNSALQASLQNLAYMADGNVPEGLYSVPSEWKASDIRDFQELFDAAVAGNSDAQSRIKFMPEGKYFPTKKIDDMRYREFSEWLMKITCSVFDVQPMEIGFEPQSGLGGAGFSEGQNIITDRKAILPLVTFLEDIWNYIIREELKHPELKFCYEGLEQENEKLEAEINEIKIRSGQRTIDEIRTDEGLKPTGVNKPFVTGQITFLDENTMNAQPTEAVVVDEQPREEIKNDTSDQNNPVNNKMILSEMSKFRLMAINRVKDGKKPRAFKSDILPESLVESINTDLQKADNADQVKTIFNDKMDNYKSNFLADARELESAIKKVVKEG